MLWTSEISRDLSSRWVKDRFPILYVHLYIHTIHSRPIDYVFWIINSNNSIFTTLISMTWSAGSINLRVDASIKRLHECNYWKEYNYHACRAPRIYMYTAMTWPDLCYLNTTSGRCCLHWLTVILSWINNHIYDNMRDEITYPFAVQLFKLWMDKQFIPYFTGLVISYPCWD